MINIIKKLLIKLYRWIDVRRAYKKLLEEILTEYDEELGKEAIRRAWGTITGKAIRYRTKVAIREYLKLIKEKHDL